MSRSWKPGKRRTPIFLGGGRVVGGEDMVGAEGRSWFWGGCR
jgi:hypothetical protein